MPLMEWMIKVKLLKQSDPGQNKLCETSEIEINTAYNEYVFYDTLSSIRKTKILKMTIPD